MLPTTKGSPTKARYHFCNFWIDHHSHLVYVTMHQKKDLSSMLQSKQEFEQFCSKHAVTIKSIRADNGIYASTAFCNVCSTNTQDLTMCAVGGHWQNGIADAERTIGKIQATARTILLHVIHHWPACINESFWPFAVHHAVNLHNMTPSRYHTQSPWELFTGTLPTRSLNDYKVFGCPTYVLNKNAQDNPSVAKKWSEQSWQSIYLGRSRQHAHNVALIYNIASTHVTPQFHAVFDKSFSTVSGDLSAPLDERLDKLFPNAWAYNDPHCSTNEHYLFSSPTSPDILCNSATAATTDPNHHLPRHRYMIVKGSPKFEQWKIENNIHAEVHFYQPPAPNVAPTETTAHSTPAAVSLPVSSPLPEGAPASVTGLLASEGEPVLSPGMTVPKGAPLHLPMHAYTNTPSPPSTGDTLTQSAMLKRPDKAQFITAQQSEIQGLVDSGVFSIHPIAHLPPRARLLNAIWSYKHKRLPTGAFHKYKSRLCSDGSQQRHGQDYCETYAPVVSWSTVRLILSLASMRGLRSKQVDFTQAFTQAPIDEGVFMKIPQGWHISNGILCQNVDPTHHDTTHYIKLLKTLYGVKQAARQWYKHISAGLHALGFKTSNIDPCLFLKDDCIVLLYVDDCLFFSKDDTTIDSIINQLSTSFKTGDQGSIQDFLGIRITTDAQSRIHLRQEGLIQEILQDLGLASSHPKPTPAIHVLHPDHNGHPREEFWNYCSIIGKLNFLAQMTRPDISMAVHNCARFSNKPTQLHEQAVKRLGPYLAHTKDKGLIYNPDSSCALDMFVDADFSGTWHKEFSHLRDCVLSRTGCVIIYNGCPIQWGSKLQSEIALSTTEAEYIALSTATRELIPLCHILCEISTHSTFALQPSSFKLPPSRIF
jgi:hypothetical protein